MNDLYLRKLDHPQARDNYRVILKENGDETELGSIGVQNLTGALTGWRWGIDTFIPMRELETEGEGRDKADCMSQFKAAWGRFAADRARLTNMEMKRDSRTPEQNLTDPA